MNAGWRPKASAPSSGLPKKCKILGGGRFSRGALFHLLRNRVYRGMIVHKDKVHPGMHAAIVDADLFEAVQTRLDANARRFFTQSERSAPAPLARRIFDADGEPMSPTASRGARGTVYRYYVSAPLQQVAGGRRMMMPSGGFPPLPSKPEWPRSSAERQVRRCLTLCP